MIGFLRNKANSPAVGGKIEIIISKSEMKDFVKQTQSISYCVLRDAYCVREIPVGVSLQNKANLTQKG